MNFTPTLKGAFIAGIGLWVLAWLTFFKMDEVLGETMVSRWVSEDRCTNWILKHRSATLLATELFNYGSHGIARPDGVVFAAGGTVVNVFMIFLVLPLRALR